MPKFDFNNADGQTLSGRLELPSAEPRAFALFAHCFTCSKDIIAPSVISKSLTEHGIAVLRFDFTGLGNSEGDFANTNFSSNVQDLMSACAQLTKDYKAPEILIGHSLGGAAVLKAAQQLGDVKAVVTLGAPSDTQHVSHLFENDVPKIEAEGQAKVQLAGRPFTIKKQFLDDIQETEILSGVGSMRKALLVMHAPLDDTVSVEHAAKIFEAAKHPKSFVSLDDAGHLLMNRKDAEYVASVIGSWVERYISLENVASENLPEGELRTLSRKGNKYTQDIYSSSHHVVADEPRSVKGDDLGMNPYELLLSSLGACTSMTLKMYAERKGIALEQVEVKLRHSKVHAQDCEACESDSGKVDVIEKEVSLSGDMTPEQRARMFEIAEMCPVNKTLQSEVLIKSAHK